MATLGVHPWTAADAGSDVPSAISVARERTARSDDTRQRWPILAVVALAVSGVIWALLLQLL